MVELRVLVKSKPVGAPFLIANIKRDLFPTEGKPNFIDWKVLSKL